MASELANEQEQAVIAGIRSKGPRANADDVFDLIAPFFDGKRGSFSSKLGSMVKRKVIFSGKEGKKTILSLEKLPGLEGREDVPHSKQENPTWPACPIADLYTRGLLEAMQAARVPGRRPVRNLPV